MQKKTKNTLQRNAWIKRANKRFLMWVAGAVLQVFQNNEKAAVLV